MAPRRRLAQRRETLGYTQNSLAKQLRVQRSTVVRWETGGRAPQPWVRPKLARVLSVSLEALDDLLAEADLAYAEPASGSDLVKEDRPARTDAFATTRHGPEIDDMKRRELLRLFSMTGVLLTLPSVGDVDADRLAYAADRPGYVDGATLDEYGKLNAHLWQVFALSASKAETLPMVRRQLDVLTACLQQSHTPDVHNRLCALTGDLFQLAGKSSSTAITTPKPLTATRSPPAPASKPTHSTCVLAP